MNYFSRLAQRSGIAPPRGAVTPGAASALEIAPRFDIAAIEQAVEIVAPVPSRAPPLAAAAPLHPGTPLPIAPAAIAPTAHDKPSAIGRDATASARPEPTATALEAKGAMREEERIVEASTPVRQRAPEREMSSSAPPGMAPEASPSRADGEKPSNVNERSPQVATPASGPAAFAVEVFVQADTTAATSPDVTRQVPAVRARRATNASPDLRLAEPTPMVDEDIAVTTRVASTTGRTREGRDARERQSDRAATSEGRRHAETRMRAGPVEVRIGTVTLQVHAAPPAAPARNSFAPHRHYLRLW